MSESGVGRSRVWLAWLPALAYMLLIWIMSSMSHPPSVEDVPFRDKGVHFLEYGALAALFAHAFRGTRPLDAVPFTFMLATVSATVFGLTDEIHQAFVPGRNSDVNDLIADTLGALLGATLYLVATRLTRKSS